MMMFSRIIERSLLFAVFFYAAASNAQWQWHNPLPSGNTILAAASDSEMTAFAGAGGMISEYSEGMFHPVITTTNDVLNDMEISSGYGVAAGEYGSVLMKSGSNWVQHSVSASVWFYGCAILPDGEAYVCGELGKIYRYSEGVWAEQSTGTTSTLKDVELMDPTHGLAVGLFGTARKYNGTSWSYVSSQTTRFLRKISYYSPARAWVAGDIGTILIWNGSNFQVETTPTSSNLWAIQAIDENEAWAAGEAGVILHRETGVWVAKSYPELPVTDFYALTLDESGMLWIAGKNGYIARFDGTDWERMDYNPADSIDYRSISAGQEPGTFWITGSFGRIDAYDGENLTLTSSGTGNDLYCIFKDPWNVHYACGARGIVLKNTGSNWQTMASGVEDSLFDLDVVSPTSFWLTGGLSSDGCVSYMILHYNNGSWTEYSESGT